MKDFLLGLLRTEKGRRKEETERKEKQQKRDEKRKKYVYNLYICVNGCGG